MTLRIGLIGASRIATTAIIAPAAGRSDVQVTAVAARNPERARAYAAPHGVPHVAADYASLIARDDVDLVYVGLPPAGHAAWTIAALEAGKPVLCEKPFARDAAEAQAMVEAAGRTGQVLIEAFHYRFHAVMDRALALVRSGALGALQRAHAVFQVPIPKDIDDLRWRADQAGGALMDLGCYPLHILRTLIGAEPEVLSAQGLFDNGVDAAMSASLAFPGGVEAQISCSMIPDAPGAVAVLEGSEGRLEIINFIAPQIGCRMTATIRGETQVLPTDGPTTYEAQLDHVLDVLAGRAAQITGGADAIANMAAIDAIYRAAGRP